MQSAAVAEIEQANPLYPYLKQFIIIDIRIKL